MDRNDKLRRAWSVGAAVALGALGLAACAPVTALNSVTVTTTVDGSDLDPGDGVCEMTSGAGDCSLRAAVDEANADDEITYAIVPPGTYVLDGGGAEDANVTGDLDVAPAAGLLTFLATPGVVIDAGGSAGGIDARSGLTFLNGISVTGSSAAGLVARSGADLWVFRGSPHGNDGPGLVYEAGAGGQIYNTTVSGNGGGIHNAGEVTLGFATVTANAGAGVSGPGTTTVTGSVVANQSGGADCTTPVTSLGGNAFGEAGCGVGPDDTLDPDVDLTPELVDGVPGFVPGPSSPDLRDAIAPGQAPCQPGMLAVDQHNVTRPLGAGCDKGALETEAATPDFVVDTAVDGVDAVPGDGVCDDGTGACTLRAAIEEANTATGGVLEVVAIAPGIDPVVAPQFGPGSIFEPLAIAGGLIIDGGGATITTQFRAALFTVDQLDTTLRDLTVSAASTDYVVLTTPTPDPGRSVILDHVAISFSNSSPSNAGLFVQGAALTVVDSTIDASGRALEAAVTDLVIDRSTVRGKDAVVSADSGAARITVRESTIRAGDLDLYVTATESILVERSTVANGYYGASLGAPQVTVRSSTFTGSAGGPSFGGASSTVDISASTFTSFGYTGLWVSGSSINVSGTVVSGSFNGGACRMAAGSTLVSGGYNSSSDSTCGFTGTGDAQNAVTTFGPLADNGGPTDTHLPAAGSTLIDAIPTGTPGLCDSSWATRDQRGVERPAGAGCDIGSVER